MKAAVAAGLIGLAVGVVGTATVLNARWSADIAQRDRLQAEQLAANSAHALTRYTQMETQKNEALKAAQLLIDRNRADATDASRAAAGLRKQLASVPARIATATRAAVDEYADTVGELLGTCTERYLDVAREADGHAVDVRTLTAAWPRADKP